MNKDREFQYARGVAPMMWVIFALSLIELFVVHFLVALKWPYIGWPLTIISTIGAVWILFWIRSFNKYPHRLEQDQLVLNLGNAKSVALDLSNISRIKRGWEQGAIQKEGIINLAGIAHPNRCIELVQPIEKGRERVFILLDDPQELDAAMSERGIAIE